MLLVLFEGIHTMVNRDDFDKTTLPFMNVLHKYALQLTTNPEAANDLLHATYLKAHRLWGQFKKGTNIKPWLFGIMENAYTYRCKKERSKPKQVCFEEDCATVAATLETSALTNDRQSHSPDEVFCDTIHRAIGSTHEMFRRVLVPDDHAQRSHERIRATADGHIGSIRSRLHKAMRLLKESLFTYANNQSGRPTPGT